MKILKLASLTLDTIFSATASSCTKTPHNSSHENTSLAIYDLAGRPIIDVGIRIEKDTSLYIQDASPIVGMKPSYSASQQSSDQWTILAACADETSVETSHKIQVSVIPTTKISPSIRKSISSHRFNYTVDCSE